MKWELRESSLDLSTPRVMGILNVTPDSFSDGGFYRDPKAALDRAQQIAEQGADIIDVGGESSRPGAETISIGEEWGRLEPVLIKIHGKIKIPVSVDTRKPEVARRAVALGVEIINDISGARDPELLEVVAKAGCGYVLMHMRGEPQDMMERAHYEDVLAEVHREMEESLRRTREAGIAPKKICIDPGFGFAKNPGQSLLLFQELGSFRRWQHPLLVGVSRKRMLRELVGEEAAALKAASVMSGLWAVQNGAHVVRVHDVLETVEMLRTYGVWSR